MCIKDKYKSENKNKMKINKIIIMLIILLFIPVVYADRIIILNLHYDNGDVSVLDKIETYGYHPDRKIQPNVGYKAEIISENGAILDSFKFKAPLEHYTDIQEDGVLHGGMVVVNKTDFALIVPSLQDAKEIKLYNEKEENILNVELIDEKEFPKALIIVAILILLIIIISIVIVRKKKIPVNENYMNRI